MEKGESDKRCENFYKVEKNVDRWIIREEDDLENKKLGCAARESGTPRHK